MSVLVGQRWSVGGKGNGSRLQRRGGLVDLEGL